MELELRPGCALPCRIRPIATDPESSSKTALLTTHPTRGQARAGMLPEVLLRRQLAPVYNFVLYLGDAA